MLPADQVLPDEAAPAFSDQAIGQKQAALGVQMADKVVVLQDVFAECRDKRADVPAAIGDQPDQHRSAVVVGRRLFQQSCLLG